jgi:hypothetical protein
MTDQPAFRSARHRRFSASESLDIPSSESAPAVVASTAAPAVVASTAAADAPPSGSSLADGGAPHPWKPLDDYAFSGAQVFVRSDEGEVVEAQYHSTRRYNPKALKWEPIQRWVICNGGGAYLTWRPVQYRVFDARIDLGLPDPPEAA